MTKAEEAIHAKLDEIIKAMNEPDDGWFTRVNKNTSWRKFHQKIYFLMLGAVLAASATHFFL